MKLERFKKTEIIENPELLVNAGNPQGELGEELIKNMNVNHENLARWGVSHLNITKDSVILDIGCGGGVNVKRFLDISKNKVYGIDYSELSVEKSREMNRKEIEKGRCEIRQESVSEMSFKNDTFDIITAFETVYFWPDFENDLKEVRRVLKKNGIFLICNEALLKKNDARQNEFIELLDCKIYSESELTDYLENSGFSKVKTITKQSKDSFTGEDAEWICAISKK